MSLSPKHERSQRPIPAHPYRDTALVNGGLSIVVVMLAALTNGDIVRAALVAVVFFVVVTSWSWWRFHERLRGRAASEAKRSETAGDVDPGGNGNGNGRKNGSS